MDLISELSEVSIVFCRVLCSVEFVKTCISAMSLESFTQLFYGTKNVQTQVPGPNPGICTGFTVNKMTKKRVLVPSFLTRGTTYTGCACRVYCFWVIRNEENSMSVEKDEISMIGLSRDVESFSYWVFPGPCSVG